MKEEEKIEEQVDDFFPIDVQWNEHPDRTEQYKATMIKKIGLEKWAQEYESLVYDSLINIRLNGIEQEIKIGELYELLSDQGESKVRYIEN